MILGVRKLIFFVVCIVFLFIGFCFWVRFFNSRCSWELRFRFKEEKTRRLFVEILFFFRVGGLGGVF